MKSFCVSCYNNFSDLLLTPLMLLWFNYCNIIHCLFSNVLRIPRKSQLKIYVFTSTLHIWRNFANVCSSIFLLSVCNYTITYILCAKYQCYTLNISMLSMYIKNAKLVLLFFPFLLLDPKRVQCSITLPIFAAADFSF